MGRFAVIGLGNFGGQVAKVLHELGHDVVGLDENEVRVKAAHGVTSYGLVGSATDHAVLSSLQIQDMDAVFVALGAEMADSLLCILHLKDLGSRRTIAKIVSQDHGRIAIRIGAQEVVYPDRDMAERLATYVSSPTIMNYLEIDPQYSIMEVVPPAEIIGLPLSESNLRQDYGVNVIGVKDQLMGQVTINPEAHYAIKDSDALIVIGRREDLNRMSRKEPKS
jgi:trk system potassium uptake protein TrkA